MNPIVVPDITSPITRPRSSALYRSAISAKPTTHVTASAAPCARRAAKSSGRVWANANRTRGDRQPDGADDERTAAADPIRDRAHRDGRRKDADAERGEQEADHRRRRTGTPAQIREHRHGDRVREDVREGRRRDQDHRCRAGGAERDGLHTLNAPSAGDSPAAEG